MKRIVMGAVAVAWASAGLFGLTGCYSEYVTPGAAANLEGFEDPGLADIAARRPQAPFPARLAVVRVQGSGYRAYNLSSHGHGRFSVVTARDVETDEQMERVRRLPDVAGVGTLNRMLLPERLDSDRDLRMAAAALHTDMLLLYTFDTQFETDELIPVAGVITLGIFPDRQARVVSTVSGLLMDVRSGYIYAALETTERQHQAANFWTSEDAADDARRRAEAMAFEELVRQFEQTWPKVVSEYAPRAAAAQ